MADWLQPLRTLAATSWWPPPHILDISVVLFAQAAGGSGDMLAQITGYGALGVVFVCAVFGKIRFEAEVNAIHKAWADDRVRWDAKEARLQNQVDELVGTYKDQALPALLASAEALRRSADQASGTAAAIQRVESAADRVFDLLRRQGG